MTLCHEVISGSMPGGETFAFGWWLNAADASAQAQADSDAAESVFSNFMLQVMAHNGVGVAAQYLKTYYYADGGGTATDVGSANINYAASSGTNNGNQSALALSLTNRGAFGPLRNRTYIPLTLITSLSGGRLPTEIVGSIMDVWQPLVTDLSLVVRSVKHNAYPLATQVSIGNVPDSQNGRRRRLVEQYQVRSV